jgi:hypothetical protein
MKVKQWIVAGCAALSVGVLADGALAQLSTTSQVFQVEAKLSGVVLTNGFAASKHTLTSADIINLARGRAMTSAVPTNEVLGLLVPCGEEAPTSLVVFDAVSSNSLVTVADINLQGAIENGVQSRTLRSNTVDVVLAADFGVSGNTTNGWTSGVLAFSMGEKLNAGPCMVRSIGPTSTTGALGSLRGIPAGNLKGIQTGTPFAIVITKGTIITSGLAWTLIE